ncbi:13942_t:CDS:1, partial [Gigaspora margarita]
TKLHKASKNDKLKASKTTTLKQQNHSVKASKNNNEIVLEKAFRNDEITLVKSFKNDDIKVY